MLLREGKPARFLDRKPEEERAFGMLGLLTSKPVLYVCNVEEGSAAKGNDFSKLVAEHAKKEGALAVVISAKIESEIATLSREERAEFLDTLGLEEAGLDRLIRAGYRLLDLITYFTVGPKEARAWTINRGTRAPAAAGVIHTDFEKGFIRAETIAYADYVALGGEAGARDAGKLRLEGKEYVVADGDVMHFRFNNSMPRSLVADRAEMLVDTKYDQDEFRGDARKDDADHHAGDRGQQQNESAERADRHRGQAVKDAGNAEQHNQRDDQPVERLDDGGRDETVPLKQIPKFKHRSFSRQVEYELRPNPAATAHGLAPNVVAGKIRGAYRRAVPAGGERAMRVGGLRLLQITATIGPPSNYPHP